MVIYFVLMMWLGAFQTRFFQAIEVALTISFVLAAYSTNKKETLIMTDDSNQDEERIPGMQLLLDNPFLLLFIGVAMPTVFYIVWGIMEIVTLPVAP